MLKFSIKAITESESNRIKGAIYPPVDVNSDEHAVATKDAHIRLKFIMLRFVAKYFWP